MSTPLSSTPLRHATVVVIGAGQAGLSAAYHLQRRGYVSAFEQSDGEHTFAVLDAEDRAGGAWLHRWASLTMATVNGIFDLPGFEQRSVEPSESARDAVPAYFAAYERHLALPILRPLGVTSVTSEDAAETADGAVAASGLLRVHTDQGWSMTAGGVINATGTWTNPMLPAYPGQELFTGRQVHTKDYTSLEEFRGLRVAIVGGGISAVQQLEEISRAAEVFWYTRREPVFRDGDFDAEAGREVIAQVTADVEAGNLTGSVVSYTGLGWTPYALAAQERGVLTRRPMFTQIEPTGVREADGSFTAVDVILWATGFRAALTHLDPLGLRNERGGIEMRGTQVAADPRVHLVGFGPSQSTVGANRAGRDAVRVLDRWFRGEVKAARAS